MKLEFSQVSVWEKDFDELQWKAEVKGLVENEKILFRGIGLASLESRDKEDNAGNSSQCGGDTV